MTEEDVESPGACVAWRVLATLEAGTLVLAACTLLLLHVTRSRRHGDTRAAAPISVLITNTSNALGSKLAEKFSSLGCHVTAATPSDKVTGVSGATSETGSDATSEADSDATIEAGSDATSEAGSDATSEATSVDALVVVGAEPIATGIEGLSKLVLEDVYTNLQLLESLSKRVKPGGHMVWVAFTGDATSDAFSDANVAFDDVLRARLDSLSSVSQCTPVWVGRHRRASQAAVEVIAELLAYVPSPQSAHTSRVPAYFRNIASKVRSYVGKLLKIIS